MIPVIKDREIESNGVTASSAFGISLKDSAHIMTILRDTLYSDKVLAILREYSANAWDAHRESGKKDVPIKVTLPTAMDPTLSIRDFGLGLSHEDVFQVYTQYGASTKRGNDQAVGMLGIGSKSGFAYSDSFTITSCHGGSRRTYVAVLDASEKGAINLLFEEPCGDETGVLIQIPIRTTDVWEFTQKAQKLFQYFVPRPDINVTLPPVPSEETVLTNGTLYRTPRGMDQEWVAIMGCVPYRVNIAQIQGPNAPDGGIGDHLSNLSGSLYFKIGEVQVSASREELKYGTLTKEALVKKFDELVQEFIQTTLKEVERTGITEWEKRLRAQVLADLKLPIPDIYKEITEGFVCFPEEPKTFVMSQDHHSVSRVYIIQGTRFLLRDDTRTLVGFGLKPGDYIITPRTTDENLALMADVEKELAELIIKAKLQGIPVEKLSTLPWCAPPPKWRKPSRPVNPKHKVATFRLTDASSSPHSARWTIEQRVPTKDDVFVVVEGFKAMGYNGFFTHYIEDKHLAEQFGGVMPPVYGYKNTERKPVDLTKCLGTNYIDWRKTFPQTLLTPTTKKALESWEWANIINFYRGARANKLLFEELGTHPITLLTKWQDQGKAYIAKNKINTNYLGELSGRIHVDEATPPSEAQQTLDAIYKRYPLLNLDSIGIDVLWGADFKTWVEYIRLIDRVDAGILPDDV